MTLRLGVIGLSSGNGHPYSWSAIINGYSPGAMGDCGFPVITQYLAAQRWPEARILGAEVTHVWAESRDVANQVARASLIENVVDSPEEMIGSVDAVLLARDDAENHLRYAAPFLKAGIPIYIDKPIALSIAAMRELYNLQRFEGQIFTCSALRYASELILTSEDKAAIGNIHVIQASTPKSWEKYAVHIIEPVLNMFDSCIRLTGSDSIKFGVGGRSLVARFAGGVTAQFNSLGDAVTPISIRVHGDIGWREFVFSDSFHAFKAALQDFIDGVRTGTCRSPRLFNERVISLVEAGLIHD